MKSTTPAQSSDTKYQRLAKDLRLKVKQGRLKPGDQLPSFVDLRNEYQVSRGTVEKVHDLLERDGLIVREQGRGVFVAEPKPRDLSGVVGFMGGGFAEARSSLYWAHLLSGIQEEAARDKIQLMLLNDTDSPLLWEMNDGLLISENEEQTLPILEKLPDGYPCVSILTPVQGMTCVLTDDAQGARAATEHLLSLGHVRIGHLVAGQNHLIENRLAGYQAALNAAGIDPHLNWVRQLKLRPGQRDSVAEFALQGRRTILDWVAGDWKQAACTAILAQNDHAAVGAIEGLREAGLRVPEDVSVVGFDGTEMYEYFTPQLTTVKIPLRRIGRTAIQILLEKIGGASTGVSNVALPAELIVGASTAPPSALLS